MKLLIVAVAFVASTTVSADVDRRRINGITFADQAIEALNLVHKGQASGSSNQKFVVKDKGGDKGGDKNKGGDNKGGDKSNNKDDRDKSTNKNKSSSSSDKGNNKGKSSSSSNDKRKATKSSSSGPSKSSSSSGDGRGVCGEVKNYCASSAKSPKSSSSSDRTVDRCIRACETDRCTRDERRHLGCGSTSASSDMKFAQKGQASSGSPIQKLVWASKEGEKKDGKDEEKKEDKKKKDEDKKKNVSKSSSSDKKKDVKSSSSGPSKSSGPSNKSSSSSGDNRKWSGSGDDICNDAPKDYCKGSSSSGDGDNGCKDACNRKHSSKYCEDKDDRKRLGCEKDAEVAATKQLRGRHA